MAVYTHLSAETLDNFLKGFDVGSLRSVKGIAEGVENTNYLVDTDQARFILTLYEKRVRSSDLPFFLGLMDHLAQKGLPVPHPIADKLGLIIHTLSNKSACLIEFLSGVSIHEPTPAQCHALGSALGKMHQATRDFDQTRPNDLSVTGWRNLAEACKNNADQIEQGLVLEIGRALQHIEARWPEGLAVTAIHADLFPNNVLFQGNEVTGLIDFYFAATDIRAYDVAVCLNSWCFSHDGDQYYPEQAAALLAGYHETHGLSPEEQHALPILCQGAALRFLLTRTYDWINTPSDALVTKLDPLAYARRLRFYTQAPANAVIPIL